MSDRLIIGLDIAKHVFHRAGELDLAISGKRIIRKTPLDFFVAGRVAL